MRDWIAISIVVTLTTMVLGMLGVATLVGLPLLAELDPAVALGIIAGVGTIAFLVLRWAWMEIRYHWSVGETTRAP